MKVRAIGKLKKLLKITKETVATEIQDDDRNVRTRVDDSILEHLASQLYKQNLNGLSLAKDFKLSSGCEDDLTGVDFSNDKKRKRDEK
jgi:hypothetical protein